MRCKHIYIFLIVVSLTFSCSQSTPWERSPWRDDLGPITKRFPMLKGVSSAKWKGGTFNDSIFSALGPSAYWMKGYVFWENSEFENSLVVINWDDIELDVESGLPLAEDLNNANWQFSRSLNQKLVGNEFVGKFYFLPDKKILYFDVFWE